MSQTSDEPQTGQSADWRDWVKLTEDVDWSDWRSWLQRLASFGWAEEQPTAPWEGRPTGEEITLSLHAFAEDEPGEHMQRLLDENWPAFRRWWSSRPGGKAGPSLSECRDALTRHMPELVPTWERLRAMVPAEKDAGTVLSLWNPPPFLTGCSQAAVVSGGPALVRNYDWDHQLFDGVVARTAYTGRKVVGTADCLWGLLDGVNDAGLAVSLTFGGRPQVGTGFGIPMVIRYVLETCETVDAAVAVLTRVPVHMSYNVTVLDSDGKAATVYVAPDRPARVTDRRATTNHQGKVEWEPYATAIRSVERCDRLDQLLGEDASVSDVVAACLQPPMYARRFHEGFGTLYTAELRPADGRVTYHWPDRTWSHSLDKVDPDPVKLHLGG